MQVKKNKTPFLCFVFIFLASYLLHTSSAIAQTEAEIQAQEAKWREELVATEADIAKWQGILNATKQGTASLQNDANVLQAKINEAKAFIRQRQVQIEQLTRDMTLKTKTINELEGKIGRGKESLATIIRSTNMLDSYSLPELILSNQNISEFFQNIDSYSAINESLAIQFQEIRENQSIAKTEREILDEKRIKEADTKAKVEADKKKVERDEAEKQKLIAINKTQEKTYEQVIAERQKKASEIRAALFRLRDSEGISFGDALVYANEASKLTGVDVAFLLGILQQESNIGQNVGSCVISDLQSGSTQSVNSGKIFSNGIHPTRDLPVLQDILKDFLPR